MLCRAIVRIPVVGFCIEWIGKRSALFYLFHPIFISLFSILVFQKQVIWGVGQAYFYVLVVVACLVGTGIVIDLIIKKMKKPQQMIEEVENNKAPEES
jgi:peptidoglycan/LPS O-acetylase OafA/YrhL